MSTGDLPHMTSSNYSSTTVPIGALLTASGGSLGSSGGYGAAGGGGWGGGSAPSNAFMQLQQQIAAAPAVDPPHPHKKQRKETPMSQQQRRLVQVLIADPDENVPLDKCVLYTGSQKMTDATDQELFFEIPIKDLLDKHNEMRTKLVNKKVKERVEYLEPAKIRELRMVVVNVATF